MANVNLPKQMQSATTDELLNAYNKLIKEMTFLLNHLDHKNISVGGITADSIRAGAIDADKIAAGAITAEKIAAGAIDADMIEVDELSALSSNLGFITAGFMMAVTIISSTIRTAPEGSQRVELRSGLADILVFEEGDLNTFAVLYNGARVAMYFADGSWFNSGGGTLNMEGTLDFSGSTPINIPMSAITGLISALNGKADKGMTTTVNTGTDTLHFTNGVLVGVT